MNTAQVIPFQKPSQPQQKAGTMYSDKFENGYVMSSRLYRKEVRPFLSDAAKNVYSELEDYINGNLKQTDHVSHRQIQGGNLKGSNKLGSATVSAGLKELIWFGVITLVEKSNKYGNKYQINDISLVEYFNEFSASLIKALRLSEESASISEALQLVKQKRISDESGSASPSDASIDNKNLLEEEEENTREVSPTPPQNRPLNFIQYHSDDRMHVSLLELTKKYPAQFDFQNQAKTSFPNHTAEQVFAELKKLAQWSIDKSKQTPQGWMNTWLKWMQKVPTAAEVQKDLSRSKTASSPMVEKPKKPRHRYGQGIVGGTIHE
ncbi:hypothetical protein ACUXVT_04565 [Acinetobacter soli]|uniref:hypothetical protein n=1 Tax=Acinetobacter soli TaxID=487316 RepID=UPI004055BDC2